LPPPGQQGFAIPAAPAPPPVDMAVDSFNLEVERGPVIPRGFLTVLGYVSSAAISLGGGYALLHWLQPDRFPWPAHFLIFW
jgi:hypothetical protein